MPIIIWIWRGSLCVCTFFVCVWEVGGGGGGRFSGLERRAGEGGGGCGISGKGSILFKTPGQHKFAASCHSRPYEKIGYIIGVVITFGSVCVCVCGGGGGGVHCLLKL